ncbi:hypothetical protein GCM10011521_28250 [Arenimonas soli]|uniref:Uncharacterized protein n=1 Tax=Arenimonas soli TaxID=2269504 RepID=A0ABQ1HTK2_9GAMM|nr:hypothetical protein [Arenimonas soli]GGA88226.1 hypothetical protein GCM10011521_28250 [Arenimonas soli]
MSSTSRTIASFIAVPAWLALSFPLMFLAYFASAFIPRLLGNFLFFWPQYLFSFRYVVAPVAGGFEPLFSPAIAPVACAFYWLAVSLGYGMLARNWPALRSLLVGFAAVVAATAILHAGFAAFGYGVQLDGP